MKPLQLKISGINSFIEEQVIDFSQLTELGLFGIFGPTGSGKSTILDAITLALYGEIPRSGKDLSGAINSQGNQGDVYYEFEIGSKQDKRRYFVSRSFKRDAQGGVRTQGVKLCDITNIEEPIVLEEKVNAVNRAVADIIGLKCNDFTRSVVLPQGNFSDFLKLSGTEKRDMLERIFALQEYGTQLNIKVRAERNKIQEDYNFLQGNLMAYEGVSQEKLDELLDLKKSLKEQVDKATEQFNKADQNYEYNKNLYDLSKEYLGYLGENKILKAQEQAIEEAKKEYQLAEKAKHIQPYIKRQNKLLEKLKGMQLNFENNQKHLQEVDNALQKTNEKWIAQQDQKENTIPKLLEEKGKMEIALTRQQAAEKLMLDIKDLEKKEKTHKEQLKVKEGELKDSNQKILQLGKNIKKDQEKIASLHTNSEYRQKLYGAQNVEVQYRQNLKEQKELSNKITQLNKELKPLSQQSKELDDLLKKWNLEQISKGEQLEKTSNEILSTQHKNMAASLAKKLDAGYNCPVCGSKEHPVKAQFLQADIIDALEENKKILEEEIANLRKKIEVKNIEFIEITTSVGLKEGFLKQNREQLESTNKKLIKVQSSYRQLQELLKLEDIEKGIKDLHEKDQRLEQIQKNISVQESQKEKLEEKRNKDQENFNAKSNEMTILRESHRALSKQVEEIKNEIKQYCGEKDPQKELDKIKEKMQSIEKDYQRLKNKVEVENKQKVELEKNQRGLEDTLKQEMENKEELQKDLEKRLFHNDFKNTEQVIACFQTSEQRETLNKKVKHYQEQVLTVKENMQRLETRMEGRSIEEEQWQAIQKEREETSLHLENKKKHLIEKNAASKDLEKKLGQVKTMLKQKKKLEHTKGLLDELEKVFKGKKFVEYISTGQLKYIAKEASQELKKITRNRYALELDADGNFIMRDDFNGGVRRGTQTLSGGETFLTSLALALALSSHIQLKGKAPLEFFFLDEGFGTLDSDLLETVMDSLEKLHSDRLSVGLISHVEELKQRVPRKLIIDPAEAGVSGSRVILEKS